MPLFLFLTPKQWRNGLLAALAFAGFTLLETWIVSPWIALAVGLVVLVAYHMSFASQTILALPHIAILIACLQYVLAAWVNFYWPPAHPTYNIGARLPLYLAYAGPVIVALTLGWALSLTRLRPPKNPSPVTTPGLLLELDILLGAGVAASLLGKLVHIESLAFVFLLLGNLRYIGVFGRMLVKGFGWSWRLGLVLGAEALLAVGSTMFHDLLLWSAWTFAVWVYAFSPRPRTVLIALALATISLPALQEAKWRLRDNPFEDDPLVEDEAAALSDRPIRRAVAWLSYIGPAIEHAVTLNLDQDFIADIAVRYNQGWIINCVIGTVPDSEPYAYGSTLVEAAKASLLPRMISPEKFSAGGREHMLRYAGIELGENTAMTIGLAGEMYANFGWIGGAIACGVYAFILGLVFRWICLRAFVHPLWWALVPFIFYSALKAEDDVAFVMNWMVKAGVLLAAVILCLPHFRHALFRAGTRASVAVNPVSTGSQSSSLALR